MEKKPNFIYMLTGLWFTIGVLFFLMLVIHTTYYLDQIASYKSLSYGQSDFAASMRFMLIIQFSLFFAHPFYASGRQLG